MEDIIKNVISKRIRKRGASYDLNENSKLSSQDFVYANRISSKIYKYSKKCLPTIVNRVDFNRLLKVIYSLVRMDEVHALGHLRLGYGNVSSLKNFRWNKKRSFESMLPWYSPMECAIADKKVKIGLPEIKQWNKQSYDARIRFLCLQFHLIAIPFEPNEAPTYLSSKVLDIAPHVNTSAKSTSFDISNIDNCLIIIMGIARYRLWSTTMDSDFLSYNASYIAADIVAVYRLRDGVLLEDQNYSQSIVPVSNEEEGTDWE